MKITVINLSGNTGKTTLSKHLLAPQLKARRIEIEDVNSGDGEADLDMAANKFKALAAELNIADDDEHFVIDIGASNAKPMIEHFAQLKRTRSAIDYWVIPVVPASKQKIDSLNTVKKLLEIGVEAGAIVMVLNNITDVESVASDFPTILGARALGVHVCDEVVLASEVFEMLKGTQDSVFSLRDNPPDFKALKKAATGNAQATTKVGEKMVLQDLAEAAAENLRSVFMSMPVAATNA